MRKIKIKSPSCFCPFSCSQQPSDFIFFSYEMWAFTDPAFVELGLWCLTPLSTIFQLYHGSQFYWEETGVHGENHRPVASHQQTFITLPKRDANSTCLLLTDTALVLSVFMLFSLLWKYFILQGILYRFFLLLIYTWLAALEI